MGTRNKKGQHSGNSCIFGKLGNFPAKLGNPNPGEYATKPQKAIPWKLLIVPKFNFGNEDSATMCHYSHITNTMTSQSDTMNNKDNNSDNNNNNNNNAEIVPAWIWILRRLKLWAVILEQFWVSAQWRAKTSTWTYRRNLQQEERKQNYVPPSFLW